MRKTALLSGVAGLLLMSAPAFAQDSTAPQTPPAPPAPATAPQEPMAPAAPATAPAQPQTLTLTPGAPVAGVDGTPLGTLEGARSTPAGQELTVRGSDGQLRGVPVSGGVEQNGPGVTVGWNAEQFRAAPAIEGAAPAASKTAPPAPTSEPMTPPAASEPTLPAEPTDPASPPTTDGDDDTTSPE